MSHSNSETPHPSQTLHGAQISGDAVVESASGAGPIGHDLTGISAKDHELRGTDLGDGSGDDKAVAGTRSRARAAGWTEATAFDYEHFTSDPARGNLAGAGRVYEWSGDYGDVGPKDEELEKILFGGDFRMRLGDHFENLELEVGIDGPTKIDPVKKFEDAGLHPVVLDNIKLAQYAYPTPIQCYVIPAAVQGMDVVAIAQTGSGKTSAYLIPILSKLMGKAKKLQAPRPDPTARGYDPLTHAVKAEPLAVIVVPTRELAIQIFDEARRMCYRSMLRPCVVYGGFPMIETKKQLGAGCDILIATPGRLCHLMSEPRILSMSRVKFTVIDEADEMLDSDWADELNTILAGGDTNEDADHIYMMFSATFPKEARKLATEHMNTDYVRVRIGRPGQAHKNIRQAIVYVDENNKRQAVEDLLLNMEPGRTIIFCNAKAKVDLLDDYLYNRGFPTTQIHGSRSQVEREDAMRAFRAGIAPILVATGVTARGWDIAGVKHIINFDLPSGMYGGIREYVHRIGRTARIGHQGLATSFYNERNEDISQDLVNVLVECDCEVPEFLSHLVPEDGNLNFDDDSIAGDEAGEGEQADVDGDGEHDEAGDGGVAAPDVWGSAPSAGDDAGFTADNTAGSAW